VGTVQAGPAPTTGAEGCTADPVEATALGRDGVGMVTLGSDDGEVILSLPRL
jgi:hypothetical protein